MKLTIITLFSFLSLSVFAGVSLDRGLYLAEDGGSCAYQVIEHLDDSVVIIFRKNPLVSLKDPCAIGLDYVIKADIIDSKSFIDVRTNKKFNYYSRY